MTPEAQQELTRLALAATDGISQVRIETGEHAVIERDPEVPDSFMVKGLDPDGVAERWALVHIGNGAVSPPSFYPRDLPFIAETQVVLSFVDGQLRIADWPDVDDSAETRMRTLMDAASDGSFDSDGVPCPNYDGTIEPPPGMLARAREWFPGLNDEGQLREAQEALQASPEQNERLENRLRQLVCGLQDRGWTIVDESESPIPFSSRTVKLELGERERFVCRMGQSGLGHVMLMEKCEKAV